MKVRRSLPWVAFLGAAFVLTCDIIGRLVFYPHEVPLGTVVGIVGSALFQTITHNRILTPAIMGFDALYILIQATVIFAFGMNTISGWNQTGKFLFEVVVMTGFASLLFRWLFSGAAHSLHLVMLVGIVFGLLFRSLSSFMIRLIDPNEFVVLQDRMFASFNSTQSDLVTVSALIVLIVSIIGWRLRRTYDIVALGRDTAINLGIAHRKVLMLTLVLIAVLVSVSTALVGPVTFFGLLVSNLAYIFMKSARHALTIPAAILLAVIVLVGGQRQRVFIAMVLCQDTDYVLLDEPLNSLDMKNSVDIMKVLRRAVDDLGKTVVVVLHDINFASCYSDYIIGMRNGKIECEGPPHTLITPPTLKQLYGMDVAIHQINGQNICVHYT